MNYSQFIYGKTTGGRNYQVVALTPDLVGQEADLESLARKYRFWGQQPPITNPIAVGVFHGTFLMKCPFPNKNNLLLVQAMSATRRNGQAAFDIQGRPFTQHRYVFIPTHSLTGLAGRLWLLLNWVMEETKGIPSFDHINLELAPISAPSYGNHWYNHHDELEKLNRCLSLKDKQGQPILLAALAALINKKRVIFDAAATNNVFSEDLLEGVLLLLPAICRAEMSVAAGALDEKVCTQANLLLKTNGSPASPLAADLIWAKRANNNFFGDIEKNTFNSHYTTLLHPILSKGQSLNILLQILDSVDSLDGLHHSTPWQLLNNGSLTTRLIPALPDPAERAKYWQSAFKNLSASEWESILSNIIDDTGLEIAWTTLQKQAKKQPTVYVPLIFQLWQNFSSQYITYILQHELPEDPKLSEVLLYNGLLTHLTSDYESDLFNLCLNLITTIADTSLNKATDLTQFILESGLFQTPEQQFSLKEAALPTNVSEDHLFNFFKMEMATILPTLSAKNLSSSRVYQELQQQTPAITDLLQDIVNNKSRKMVLLSELAVAIDMSVEQRSSLYARCINAWQPAYKTTLMLLSDLVTQWIATYSPDERPHITTLFVDMLDWLQNQAPQALYPLLTVSGAEFAFEDWQIIAEAFYPDLLGQSSFIDHVTVGQPVTFLTRQWLLTIVEDDSTKNNFENSYTWHNLQADGPTWLAEGVAQLLGWQSVALSALMPMLDRLQNALDLPQATLFKFLEALPHQNDGDLGMMLSAYLPQLSINGSTVGQSPTLKEVVLEEIPLWQMLNAQAPKVAQIYKILAEGEKNSAVDKFNQLKLNAALSEAPEYAVAMAHWLQLCGKANWLSGRLLETTVEQWLASATTVDVTLLASLLQPDLTAKYSVADWLALASVCWLPDYQSLWPLSGQPGLGTRHRAQVLNVAKDCLRQYTTPTHVEKLVMACQNWGLNHAELAELVSHIPKQACNFSLIQPYLYLNGLVIEPHNHTAQNLLTLLMTLKPSTAIEQTHVASFFKQLISQQLQHDDGLNFLIAWYDIVADKALYQQALNSAVLQLAPIHFSMLVQCAHQLHGQTKSDLAKTLVTALDNYWIEQKHQLKN